MAINSNINANPAIVDYGKYVQIVDDSRFPNISSYNGTTSTLKEYPKYATLTYNINSPSNSDPQPIVIADSTQVDASNRLRVSTQGQNWWFVPTVDKDGDLRMNESFSTGASSFFVQNLACVLLTSGLSLTGSAIRASRRRLKVRPSVSHQWSCVVNFDGNDDGVIKRAGMFTNYNGFFYELSGSDFNVVVRRRLIDGTLQEARVNKSNFNVDKLDGSGSSGENWSTAISGSITSGAAKSTIVIGGNGGSVYNVEYTLAANQVSAFAVGTKATITGVSPSTFNGCVLIQNTNTATNKLTATYVLDPGTYSSVSNATINQNAYHTIRSFWCEFGGSKTSTVHFGMDSSMPVYLHTFDFSNDLGTQFFNAPALMERKEIVNYKALSYYPSFTLDGSSFTTEAEDELNPGFGAAYNNNGIVLSAVGMERPILGIGLRAGEPYQRGDIQIQNVSVLDTANTGVGGSGSNAAISGAFHWRLILNPGLSGVPAPVNIGKASRIWRYTGGSALTGTDGIELISGYTQSTQNIDIRTSLNFLNLGSNIQYTDADKVVLVVKLLAAGTNTANVVGAMNFIEAL